MLQMPLLFCARVATAQSLPKMVGKTTELPRSVRTQAGHGTWKKKTGYSSITAQKK